MAQQKTNTLKILIIRVSAIGDVIHTLPAVFFMLRELSTETRADINWIVQEKAVSLLRNQSFINNLLVLPDKFLSPRNLNKTLSVIRELRKTEWDAIIDFQGLLKTSILYMFLSGKKFGFDAKNSRERISTLFTHSRVTPVYENIIQKNLALASHVVSTLCDKKTCPTIDALKKDFYLDTPDISAYDNNFVALAPNTTWESKHWPKEFWLELMKKLSAAKIKTVLIGKDFGGQAKWLSDQISSNGLSISIAPRGSLLEVASLIKRASLLIAPDTGLLHLADFLGTETIGIFGPTSKVKNGPFLTQKNVSNAIQVDCIHRYKKSHGEVDCMEKLLPDQVFEIVLLRLKC